MEKDNTSSELNQRLTAPASSSHAPEALSPQPQDASFSESPLVCQYTSACQAIAKDRRERYEAVAALLRAFGQQHLDVELTGFMLELWTRICRKKASDCLRGKIEVWAASVTHVIARMNFLFDKAQPVHTTFDTICSFYKTSKTTVGGKATEIERKLRLREHNELGLCRRELVETFTYVQFSDGIVVPWKFAKEGNYLPPDAKIEDLF
jgi:hypothetical protein